MFLQVAEVVLPLIVQRAQAEASVRRDEVDVLRDRADVACFGIVPEEIDHDLRVAAIELSERLAGRRGLDTGAEQAGAVIHRVEPDLADRGPPPLLDEARGLVAVEVAEHEADVDLHLGMPEQPPAENLLEIGDGRIEVGGFRRPAGGSRR